MSRHLRFDLRRAGRVILIVLAALFVIDAAFWLFAVRPTVRRYQQLLAKTEPTYKRIDQRREVVENRENFLAGLERATTDLSALRNEYLATRDERMIDVQAELDRLERQFNIASDSISYGNQLLLDEGLDRFEMVVPLEGGYANLRRFLQAVEDSEEFLLVERVVLGQGKEGGSLLQLNITLTTYFNAPPELLERQQRERRSVRRR